MILNMTFNEFENVVNDSLKQIPGNFREILDKNQIKILAREKVPNPVRNNNMGKTVFGIFIGVPVGRFFSISTEPTRIELYKESFESIYPDPVQMKRQILITVVHEIAHYFGFSEDEIRKLGY
jgi:predicted Zn-dependent protease with MMP-like domain